MYLKDPLITPEEAYRIFWKTSFLTMTRAMEIADYCEQHNDTSIVSILGCIWNAGRVQGIREERQKRRRTAEHRTITEQKEQ